MKSRLIGVFLIAAWVGVLAACGSTTPTVSPTPAETSTPTDIADTPPDVAVQAYLALMDELATELTRFGDPDGPGGSTGEDIDLVNNLETYTPFFFSLDQERLEQVLATYGQQIEEGMNGSRSSPLLQTRSLGTRPSCRRCNARPLLRLSIARTTSRRPPRWSR